LRCRYAAPAALLRAPLFRQARHVATADISLPSAAYALPCLRYMLSLRRLCADAFACACHAADTLLCMARRSLLLREIYADKRHALRRLIYATPCRYIRERASPSITAITPRCGAASDAAPRAFTMICARGG